MEDEHTEEEEEEMQQPLEQGTTLLKKRNVQAMETQLFRPVSVSTLLRLCRNFKSCKYCLCHCCYKILGSKEINRVQETGAQGNKGKQKKREGTSPSSHRKEVQGQEKASFVSMSH